MHIYFNVTSSSTLNVLLFDKDGDSKLSILGSSKHHMKSTSKKHVHPPIVKQSLQLILLPGSRNQGIFTKLHTTAHGRQENSRHSGPNSRECFNHHDPIHMSTDCCCNLKKGWTNFAARNDIYVQSVCIFHFYWTTHIQATIDVL
uniref:TF-B3 domain-containing protein n=1 Tax=Oryza punctata TaxID=4537 RepID=A0A0E0L0L0_ORYPU